VVTKGVRPMLEYLCCLTLVCYLERFINGVKYVYIMILKPSFNILFFKKLFIAHKDHIWLSRTITCTNQSNKDLGFVV
jgi:hypothetical protein